MLRERGELKMRSDRQKRVEQRAHDIWVAEGRPHGKHEEHWHRAEREIAQEEKGGRTGRRAAASPAKSTVASKTSASKARPKTGATAKKTSAASRSVRPATAAKPAGAAPAGRRRSTGTQSPT
jgi:hypothetical protein